MKTTKYFVATLILLVLTGCASYRTDTELDFDSAEVVEMPSDFLILEGDLLDIPYTSVGTVDAIVKKLTLFHRDPTKEQVNLVLFNKAAAMGANAVINVEYKDGIGFDTWGYLEASGIAVRTENGKSDNEQAKEEIENITPYMGIAVEEITSKTYDKILWVKALTLAEGDKEKQKGIYINLRSSQLASLNNNPVEQTTFDLSGTYIAIYTGNYLKRSRDFQNGTLKVKLVQDGEKITGTFGSKGKVWGDIIDSETIRFELFATGGYSRKGTWKIDPVDNKLKGKMTSDEVEDWNLTKIE